MISRRNLLPAFVLFLPLFLSAQNTAERIIAYTKDGSVFNGQILREDEGFIYIALTIGDTVRLNRDFVKKSINSTNVFVHDKGRYHFKEGIFGDISLAFIGDGWEGTTQFDMIAGYRLRPNLSLGGGVSFTHSDMSFLETWLIHDVTAPFAFARFYPRNKRRRFYLEGKLGYGFINDPNADGGINVQPGLGWHFASKNKFKMYLGLSQFLWNVSGIDTHFDWMNNPVITDYNIWYNRTLIKIGVQFR